jgi:hypothetical protein
VSVPEYASLFRSHNICRGKLEGAADEGMVKLVSPNKE